VGKGRIGQPKGPRKVSHSGANTCENANAKIYRIFSFCFPLAKNQKLPKWEENTAEPINANDAHQADHTEHPIIGQQLNEETGEHWH
jgi:hypothetical protein